MVWWHFASGLSIEQWKEQTKETLDHFVNAAHCRQSLMTEPSHFQSIETLQPCLGALCLHSDWEE